jgi:site-specific DNA-cytosine methylase
LIARTLTKGSATGQGVNQPGRRQEDDVNIVPVAGPLGGGNDGTGRRSEDDPNFVTAFSWQQGDDSKWNPDGHGRSWVARAGDYAAGLSASGRHDAVAGHAVGVRRLTPTECERLQGLPDGWTQLGDTADSKRYSALGDAVTATVAEWIGRRLLAAGAVDE